MAPWLWSRVISVISVAFSKSSQEIGMLWGKYYALPSALMKNALSWESSRTFARQYLQLIILTCGSSCGHCNIKIEARITFWTMCPRQSHREPSCLTCICMQFLQPLSSTALPPLYSSSSFLHQEPLHSGTSIGDLLSLLPFLTCGQRSLSSLYLFHDTEQTLHFLGDQRLPACLI